jgi:hypothetical protein
VHQTANRTHRQLMIRQHDKVVPSRSVSWHDLILAENQKKIFGDRF